MLTGLNVVDPAAARVHHGWTIVCDGDTIVSAGRDQDYVPVEGDRPRPLRGWWAMPGLCDAALATPDPMDLVRSVTLGVTTARVSGSPKLVTAMRARMDANEFEGPELLESAAPAGLVSLDADGTLQGLDATQPMIAGSGPGRSLDRVLRAIVDAGRSPAEALAAATIAPAAAFGNERLGRIAPGARADILICGADPLVSIEALAEVRAVVIRGRLRLRGWLAATRDRVVEARRDLADPWPGPPAEALAHTPAGLYVGRFQGIPFARLRTWVAGNEDGAWPVIVEEFVGEPVHGRTLTLARASEAKIGHRARAQRFDATLARTATGFDVEITVDGEPPKRRAVARPDGETLILDTPALLLVHRATLQALRAGVPLHLAGQQLVYGDGPIYLAASTLTLKRVDALPALDAMPGIAHRFRARTSSGKLEIALDRNGLPLAWRTITPEGTIHYERTN